MFSRTLFSPLASPVRLHTANDTLDPPQPPIIEVFQISISPAQTYLQPARTFRDDSPEYRSTPWMRPTPDDHESFAIRDMDLRNARKSRALAELQLGCMILYLPKPAQLPRRRGRSGGGFPLSCQDGVEEVVAGSTNNYKPPRNVHTEQQSRHLPAELLQQVPPSCKLYWNPKFGLQVWLQSFR
jgi:hypothetical protein